MNLAPTPVYPRPHVPLKPILSRASLRTAPAQSVSSLLDAGHALYVTSGRVAIALALRHMGVTDKDKILVPAYHCTSMIEPIVWSSATPVFYRIGADTSVDLDHVERKLDKATRALMIAHYYGFPQNLPALRAFCDSRGLVLIEDCAHAFFGSYAGRPLGSYGDYAVGSAMKFFPIYDGGCLVSSRHTLDGIIVRSGGWRLQTKAAINILEQTLEYKRLSAIRPLVSLPIWLKDLVWNRWWKSARDNVTTYAGPGAADGAYAFDPDWLEVEMSTPSRLIIKLSDRARIAATRRAYYRTLLRAFADCPGCHPLFPELADNVVPYVFPLLVDRPEVVFDDLKRQGVPILRFGEFLWNGVDASICPVAVDYSRRLFQFPCHQELTLEEIDWLITRVQRTLARHH